MRIAGVVAAASCLALTAATAEADDTAEVLRQFDLIGTWSADCSKDIAHEAVSRITYDLPPKGPPTVTIVSHYPSETITTHQEILSAERIADDKMKLTARLVGMDRVDSDNRKLDVPPVTGQEETAVFQKDAQGIRVLDYQSADGQHMVKNGLTLVGKPTPISENALLLRDRRRRPFTASRSSSSSASGRWHSRERITGSCRFRPKRSRG